jgi:hypothetical protein
MPTIRKNQGVPVTGEVGTPNLTSKPAGTAAPTPAGQPFETVGGRRPVDLQGAAASTPTSLGSIQKPDLFGGGGDQLKVRQLIADMQQGTWSGQVGSAVAAAEDFLDTAEIDDELWAELAAATRENKFQLNAQVFGPVIGELHNLM